MICIIVFAIINGTVVSSTVLPECYLTMKACTDDIPRRMSALVPADHVDMLGFNCAPEEKDA